MNKGLLKINEINREKARVKWLSINSSGKMKCCRCKDLINLSDFREIDRGKYEYKRYNSFCNFCDAKRTSIYKNKKIQTIEGKVDFLMSNIRKRIKDKYLECDIDKDFILELWEKQNERCFYTNVKMELGEHKEKKDLYNSNFNVVSVDRFDSTIGYTKNNTVLCCWGVNNMKQQMTYDQLMHWCNLLVNTKAQMLAKAYKAKGGSYK